MLKPQNFAIVFVLFALSFFVACSSDDPSSNEIEIPDGYSLAWNDEFDGSNVDLTKWGFETGDGTDFGLPAGWGNNEKQLYTFNPQNVSIESDGDFSVLAITAQKDGDQYTSAKLTTNNLMSVRFGRVEVKAKLPKGQGIWPAAWFLGDNRDLISWPGCGEIDLIEVLGHQPNKLYNTVHFTNDENKHGEIQGEHTLSSGDFSEDYHVFALEWTPEVLTFFLDGEQTHQVVIEEDMKEFQRSAYLILNVAVGGFWPGDPDETTTFPQSMLVDYVRVFTKDGFEAPAAPDLVLEEESIGQIIEPSIGAAAIRDSFEDLGELTVLAWGGGGEPVISASETAIDGDQSLSFDFPGGSWGGAYLELAEAANLSGYEFLKFSLHKPETLVDAEIKLESASTNALVMLKDYTGTPVSDGFVEYSIPLSDFVGLDVGALTIPFAMWNPTDASVEFAQGTVLIDDLHFAN